MNITFIFLTLVSSFSAFANQDILAKLEQAPQISRIHFMVYCGQCHKEWMPPLSSDRSADVFFRGMRSIMLYEMSRGEMPKPGGKYIPSESLRQKMMRFLDEYE